MIVNHVVSESIPSRIFNDIFAYFKRYAPEGSSVVVTQKPLASADVHHYHRCHMEEHLTDSAVCTVHHDPREPDPGLPFDRFLPRYAEARLVICLNQGQRRFLESYGISHAIVISHGYNPEVLRPRARQACSGGKTRLGILSRYYGRRCKGEAYLHDLVKYLSPDQFAFVLTGERRLVTAQYLMSLGYEVRLFEMLPYRLFQNLYEAFDYLLVCSTFEGGPANVMEAMATHTPVIATPVGCVPDFIVDGRNGVILSQDPEEDAFRLSRLADPADPLGPTLRTNAPELREACPTWEDVVARHFEAYRSIPAARP